MNGNTAILDRAAPAEAAAKPSRRAAPQVGRAPWLQLRSINHFAWSRYELPVAALPPALEGLRILHLSDIHLKSTWHPAIDALHERVGRDPPDLIFITGDFVEDKFDSHPAMPMAERFVKGLRSRFGMYAVMGNHDGDLIGPRIASWGVKVLPVGSSMTIDVRGAQVELLGLAGVDRNDLRLQQVLDMSSSRADQPRVPRIVLSHYPDALVQLQAHDLVPPLFFAGHTHGGQVCLPGGMPMITHDALPRRYSAGVHRFGPTWLIVSRGMGFSGYPIRLFCSAEVVEVELRGKDEG